MKNQNEITANPQQIKVDNLSPETKFIHQLIVNEDRRGYTFFKTQLTPSVKNELKKFGYGVNKLGGNNYKIMWRF